MLKKVFIVHYITVANCAFRLFLISFSSGVQLLSYWMCKPYFGCVNLIKYGMNYLIKKA